MRLNLAHWLPRGSLAQLQTTNEANFVPISPSTSSPIATPKLKLINKKKCHKLSSVLFRRAKLEFA